MTTNVCLPLPTVHLNGSSQRDLIETACEFADKLREALNVAGRAWPNARDYYPQGAGAYGEAEFAWESMVAPIRDAITALETYVQGADDMRPVAQQAPISNDGRSPVDGSTGKDKRKDA